jgi:hypothetical protein
VGTYKGSLKVAATADVVEAVFDVGDDALRVVAGDEELGSWALADIGVQHRGDGLHLDLAGEAIIVKVQNQEALADDIASARPAKKSKRFQRKPRKSRQRPEGAHVKAREPRPRPAPPRTEVPSPSRAIEPAAAKPDERPGLMSRLVVVGELFDRDNWEGWLNDNTIRWSIASAGVVIFALMAIFATNTLGMILVLLGMVALIVAALAVSEDLSAYRVIPNALSETMLVIIGAVMMVIGALLIFIG